MSYGEKITQGLVDELLEVIHKYDETLGRSRCSSLITSMDLRRGYDDATDSVHDALDV